MHDPLLLLLLLLAHCSPSTLFHVPRSLFEVSVFQAVTQKLPENLLLDVFAHESEFRIQSHKLLANMAMAFICMHGVYVHVTVLGSHSE